MSLLEKFIDSLDVKLGKFYFVEVVKPFCYNGALGRNVLIQLNKGNISLGGEEVKMPLQSFYFVPESKPFFGKVGTTGAAIDIGEEILSDQKKRSHYLQNISGFESWEKKENVLSVVSFDLVLYNAFSFFPLLEIQPFSLPYKDKLGYLMKQVCLEAEKQKLGRDLLIKNYLRTLVIYLCRYIESKPDLAAYTERLHYLTDKRLVDVIRYIQHNLSKDLSNRAIADVACVSEEYVGQFFKSLTHRNLQDFIESQRLEKAMQLLRSHPDNVREISLQVGFKDAAYFGKRFKMKYGINANSVKQGRAQVV